MAGKATYGDLVSEEVRLEQDRESCFDGGSGGTAPDYSPPTPTHPNTTCVPGPRGQRQKLAQINNSAGSQIQFTISHRALRAIIIKVIDCNQSNQGFRFEGSQSF